MYGKSTIYTLLVSENRLLTIVFLIILLRGGTIKIFWPKKQGNDDIEKYSTILYDKTFNHSFTFILENEPRKKSKSRRKISKKYSLKIRSDIMERKNYKISQELFKFPYNGNFEKNDNAMFLEKFCCCTIKVRKKIIKKAKWLIVYADFVLRLTNGIVPSQAIGLAIPTQTPAIMRSSHSNVGLSKKTIIAQVIKEMPAEIDFTEREIDPLYHLGIEWRNNSLSQEELITKISNLRGGSFIDVVPALGLIGAMIVLSTNDWGLAFQPNPNAIIPPHLQLLYGNQQPGNYFG